MSLGRRKSKVSPSTASERDAVGCIGRDHELLRLGACLERIESGRGCFAVMSAPAGTGKTHFLNQFAATAGHDGRLLVHVHLGPSASRPYEIWRRVANETMDSSTVGIPLGRPGSYHLTGVLFTQYFTHDGAALEAQVYRLANWRVSGEEINYRRFFDVNELIGLSMENPRVFAAHISSCGTCWRSFPQYRFCLLLHSTMLIRAGRRSPSCAALFPMICTSRLSCLTDFHRWAFAN